MRLYNVIWADDDIASWVDEQSQVDYKKDYQIDVIATATTGEMLRKVMQEHIDLVDAVIVDANFDANKDVPSGERVISGLRRAFELNRKYNDEERRGIPFFLFTGRPKESLLDEAIVEEDDRKSLTELFIDSERFYTKAFGAASLDRLFKKIKSDVDETKTSDFEHRRRHANEFVAAALLPEAAKWLIKGLRFDKAITGEVRETKDYFNPARQIWESIFKECKTKQLLPNISSMNGVIPYLKGKEQDYYKQITPIMPRSLIHSLEYFLNITQDGSHTGYDLKLGVVNYVNTTNNVNLYRTILYITMDLLLWYKALVDNPPKEKLWETTYKTEGVLKIVNINKHTKYYVPTDDIIYELQVDKERILNEGIRIRIKNSVDTRYPFDVEEGSVTQYVFNSDYDIVK